MKYYLSDRGQAAFSFPLPLLMSNLTVCKTMYTVPFFFSDHCSYPPTVSFALNFSDPEIIVSFNQSFLINVVPGDLLEK